MSYMRDCEYVERNGAYKEAESRSGLSKKDFYAMVKEKARQVPFEMRKHNLSQTMGNNGQWERWTNGQDPIWSTYHGYVTWTGTAEQLLQEVAVPV